MSLELLAQIQKQRGEELHVCLIDIKKAFDSVEREQTFNLLELSGYDQHEAGLLKAIYRTETSSLILNGKVTNAFRIHQGVRQGASSSPLLFNLTPELLVRMLRRDGSGIYIGDRRID